jgi:hypothetical protein
MSKPAGAHARYAVSWGLCLTLLEVTDSFRSLPAKRRMNSNAKNLPLPDAPQVGSAGVQELENPSARTWIPVPPHAAQPPSGLASVPHEIKEAIFQATKRIAIVSDTGNRDLGPAVRAAGSPMDMQTEL